MKVFYRGKVSEIDKLNFKTMGEVTVIISEKKINTKDDLDESDKKK